MISLTPRGIRWERGDVRSMARVIGSEHAVIKSNETFRYAPVLLSILKQAMKRGVLDRRAERAVRDYDSLVAVHREAHKLEDAELDLRTDPRAAKYFKHQRADLAWLYQYKPEGVLNASEAGTGKTLIGIRYPLFLGAERNMVIVPNAAKDQCAAEIRRWTTDKQMPIVIVRGTVAEQVKQITSTKVGWVIGHWESLYYAAEGWLDDAWDYAWLDEVHNIANRRTERAGTVRALRATWRMATSAHPYANGVNELFPVLQFLYPEVYTSFWRWANLHIEIEEGPFGGLDLRTPRRPHLLQWEIEPFRIRRLWKNVWPNLKPVTHNIERVDLTSHGRKEYDRLRKQFFVSLGTAHGERNVLAIPSVLARCTRLRQYLIDPGILGAKEKSIKYPIIAELVKDLCGTPPVIFSMYRQAALRLKEHLEKRGLRVGTMLGGMKGRLEKRKQAFLRGKYDALIVLISVGGQSLNLGKYGKVIYLDHPWTHRDVEQTIGRVRRPEEGTGKLVPVTVYHVVARDSYEVRMAEIRAEKHEDFGKVFSVADATALFH